MCSSDLAFVQREVGLRGSAKDGDGAVSDQPLNLGARVSIKKPHEKAVESLAFVFGQDVKGSGFHGSGDGFRVGLEWTTWTGQGQPAQHRDGQWGKDCGDEL